MTLLLWVYLLNATLLIVHEIDSAYWNEWELFKLPGGIQLFNVIHIPLVFLILYGAVEVYKESTIGFILSLVLSFGGVFAFTIHHYFMWKGNPQFDTPISKLILYATLFISLVQAWITLS